MSVDFAFADVNANDRLCLRSGEGRAYARIVFACPPARLLSAHIFALLFAVALICALRLESRRFARRVVDRFAFCPHFRRPPRRRL